MYLCHNCHHLLAFSGRSSTVPPSLSSSSRVHSPTPLPSRRPLGTCGIITSVSLSLSLSTEASPCARASPNPVTSRRKVPMKLPRNPAQVSRSGAPSVEHSTHSHAAVVVVCALSRPLFRKPHVFTAVCLSPPPPSTLLARSPSCSGVHSARRGVHIK